MSVTSVTKYGPLKIDFVFCSFNEAEREGVAQAFDLKTKELISERGLKYQWGHLKVKRTKSRITFAHVYFNDKQGDKARPIFEKIITILRPDYLFLLGTTGGYTNLEGDGSHLGDLVVSRLVHKYERTRKGKNKHLNPLLEQLIPPDSNLLNCAQDATREINERKLWKVWIPNSRLKTIRDNLIAIRKEYKIRTKLEEQIRFPPKVRFTEICSDGQKIIADLSDSDMKAFRHYYPRATAYEMESGIIANVVYELYTAGQTPPGYIVIKGVSDTIEAPRAMIPDAQKDVRDTVGAFVAELSARFAKYVVENLVEYQPKPIPGERIRKNCEDPESIKTNELCSGVFHGVTSYRYSDLASKNLEVLISTSTLDGPIFFTVFSMSPHDFYTFVLKEYKEEKKISSRDVVPVGRLKTWVLDTYPHFNTFRKIAEDNPSQPHRTVRILILNDMERWYDEDVQKYDEWRLFAECNGDVPCWIIQRSTFEPISDFLKDYAIIGDRILLDWDDKGKTLVISDVSNSKGSAISLRKLYQEFQKDSGENRMDRFTKLQVFDLGLRNYFNKIHKSHLFPAFRYSSLLGPMIEVREYQATQIGQHINSGEISKLLFVGSGYGDEIEAIASRAPIGKCLLSKAIDIFEDIDEVEAATYMQPSIVKLKNLFTFEQRDLLHLPREKGNLGEWDCVQCAFVLEDIPYEEKKDAFDALNRLLGLNKYLILAEIAIDNLQRDQDPKSAVEIARKSAVSSFYGKVIELATHGQVNRLHKSFVDHMETAKLLAESGQRDFFENDSTIRDRLQKSHFVVVNTFKPVGFEEIIVYVAQKQAHC